MKNLRKIKGNWYYRLKIWNGVKEKETPIPLKTKNKTDAIRRAKIVLDNADDLKSGVIQKFQWEEYFPWLNDTGTSILVKQSVQDIIPDYLEYRKCMVRKTTVQRDRVSLKQLTNFFFKPKPIEELSYKDIEGTGGLVEHLRHKGCTDVGINITLRHLKIFFNWLCHKERLIPEPIRFHMIPEGEQLYCYFNEAELKAIYEYDGLDDFYKRCFFLFEQTGMRPGEAFVGDIVGNWYLIDQSKRKNKTPMQLRLDDKLKSILKEMQAFRDSLMKHETVLGTGSKIRVPAPSLEKANAKAYDKICRKLMMVVRALGFKGKKATLYSFRHTYAIRRVTMTSDIFQVQREMGHTTTTTTQRYLRFPEQRRLDDFPSLKAYIKEMGNKPKSTTRVTDSRATSPYIRASS